MKKLEGHKFKLKSGDYILFKKRKVDRSYIGVVRDYDGVKSKAGVVSEMYALDDCGILLIKELFVFCWYKRGFIILRDVESGRYKAGLDDIVDLYKMNKKDVKNFERMKIKLEMLKTLK